MALRMQQLAEAVIKIVDESKTSKQAARAVAGFLVAERQTKNLHNLLRKLEEIQHAKHDRLEITATSASPLSEVSKRDIRRLFDAKDMIVHEEIDKELLGGVHVRALDKVADFSVQARIRRLRQGRTT